MNAMRDMMIASIKPLVWKHVTSTGDRNVHEAYGVHGRCVAWPDGAWRLHGKGIGGLESDGTLDAAQSAAGNQHLAYAMALFDINSMERSTVTDNAETIAMIDKIRRENEDVGVRLAKMVVDLHKLMDHLQGGSEPRTANINGPTPDESA